MSQFFIFRSVVLALFIRELKTRFGKGPFGIVWLILEPLLQMMVFLYIFSIFQNRMMPQVPYVMFLITGTIPYYIFQHIITGLMSSIDANKSLFAYGPVKPFDTYISRTILEVMIYSSIFIIISFVLGWVFGIDITIYHPLEALLSLSMIVIMAFAVGVGVSVLTFFFPFFQVVVKIMLFVLYLISGVMFPIWSLPADFQNILQYNPMLHLIEIFRESYFSSYPHIEGVNLSFPLIFSFIMLYIGLWFYSRYRLQLGVSL